MKRSPIKRGTKQMARGGFKAKTYAEVVSVPKKKKKPVSSRTGGSKAKVKGTSWHKKKLWKLFSKFVRNRDKYKCVCCGKEATGSGMHGGHFITGATCPPKLFFDETNVHAQCYRCNINLSGNWVVYEKFMIDTYGEDHVADLKRRQKHEQGQKVEIAWYQDKIKHYDVS